MASPPPDTTSAPSHHEIRAIHRQSYHSAVRSGEITPLTYPMASYHVGILLLFLLIPPSSRLHCRATRYATFAAVAYWHVFLARNCRALNENVGFVIGIASAWVVLWGFCLCVARDGKVDFVRVNAEVKCLQGMDSGGLVEGNDGGAFAASSPAADVSDGGVRRRVGAGESGVKADSATTTGPSEEEPEAKAVNYYWQSYPEFPFSTRTHWIWDLFTNFRGPHWNWCISSLPPPPLQVQLQLHTPFSHSSTTATANTTSTSSSTPINDNPVSRNGIRRFDTRGACIRHNLRLLLSGYLLLDALTTLSHHDPYFWRGGPTTRPAPTYFAPFIRDSALLLRTYRLLTTMTLIWIALRTVFCLEPLFFVGILGPLVDRGIVSNEWYVRTRAWTHPPYYGSFGQVMDRGLAGWWGGWWHQAFRVGFEMGGAFASKACGLDPQIQSGKAVAVFAAFSLSGFLHASGSAMQNGGGAPLAGSFLFFFVQAVGVVVEQVVTQSVNQYWRRGRMERGGHVAPRWVRRAGNLVFVHAWLFLTGSLFADDLARGGLWLYEPVMFSPLRALGLGVEGDGAFCWGRFWAGWHSDRKWLLSGIAF